jgi:hypothetical protein
MTARLIRQSVAVRRIGGLGITALFAVLMSACSDDSAEPTTTTEAPPATAIVNPTSEAELGSALTGLGLGCEDLAETLSNAPNVNGAECTIGGTKVVLLTFDDETSQREYLSGKPEELCPMFLTMGETEAAIVVGEGWTARPADPSVARDIAEATGAELRAEPCEQA